MDLRTYLRETKQRPGDFARRIGVAPSTISGWLHDPRRAPSRRLMLLIEDVTAGAVTARDFASGEDTAETAPRLRHVTVTAA
jgi:DNA-binding transcriptional regulator YdaS (Cro superfamily)